MRLLQVQQARLTLAVATAACGELVTQQRLCFSASASAERSQDTGSQYVSGQMSSRRQYSGTVVYVCMLVLCWSKLLPTCVWKKSACRAWLCLPIHTGLLTKSLASAQVVRSDVSNIDRQMF